jgi:hypothetical protein
MIIKSPTGLYRSILPINGQSGNITYTISTQEPPRTNVRATHLPVSEELKPAPARIFNDEVRRAQFGELVLTIAEASRTTPGSNTKLFEVGEILEFEINPPADEIETVRAPGSVEIRHDTNLLNLAAAGLDQDEIELLTKESERKQATLEKDFIVKKAEIDNLDTNIRENQKNFNETNKALRATKEIFGIIDGDLTFDNPIYQKLLLKISELEVERDLLIFNRNNAGKEAEQVYRSLIRISELVR